VPLNPVASTEGSEVGLLPSPDLPSVIENLPSGFVGREGLMSGVDVDGWLAVTSSFALYQPYALGELVVKGKVPLVHEAGFTTEVQVLIDGREAARTTLGTGRFAVRTPVEDGPARRLVELRFSAVQQLLPPDFRMVGAYMQRIGFEEAPADQPAPVAAAPSVAGFAERWSARPPSTPPVPDAVPMSIEQHAPLPLTDSSPPGGLVDAPVASAALPPPARDALPAADIPPPCSPSPATRVAAPPSPAAPADHERAAAEVSVTTAPTLPPPPARIFASETVFGPSAPPILEELWELWRYRHLFRALVWRNVRIEFDASRLGSLWAIARPVLFAVVFGFFRNLSGANTYVDLPYIPYLFSGLLLWTYFTDVATNTASAIRSDLALLTKVYYPRLLSPLVPAVSNLLTLAVGMVPLVGMMLWMGLRPGWMLVLLPVVVLPCIVLALGIGLLVSSLSIENRDWERVLAYSLTIGLWLSPVIYSPEMIPHGARTLYHLNPMAGPLLAFRAVLFDGIPFPLWEWAYGVLAACVVFTLGLRVFRRTEVRLVDRL
jgi:lipopolysaccharide transport system permease protein